jgi:hypothetical protein
MSVGPLGQAAGLFAVTNIDDIVVLALFFGQATGRAGALRVVLGQYLGFAAILAVSVAAALGAALLPGAVIPYPGLLPGVRDRRHRRCSGTWPSSPSSSPVGAPPDTSSPAVRWSPGRCPGGATSCCRSC